jgi:hypothetical protein
MLSEQKEGRIASYSFIILDVHLHHSTPNGCFVIFLHVLAALPECWTKLGQNAKSDSSPMPIQSIRGRLEGSGLKIKFVDLAQ